MPFLAAIPALIIAGGFVGALTSLAVSIVASLVISAILPKPKLPKIGSFGSQITGRQEQIFSPIMPHRTIYGEVMVGSTIVYGESMSIDTSNQNEQFSLILVFAGHEVDSITEYWIDDDLVTIDGNNDVQESPWAGFVKIFPHLGSDSQAADTDLVTNSAGNWTNAHRLRGRAYLHVQLKYDRDVFSGGVPKFRVLVKGKKVLDTRTSPDTTAWSENPALLIQDYLRSKLAFAGVGGTEIDATTFEAAANVCEENVALAGSPVVNEDRYTANGTIDDNELPGSVLRNLLSSMAGTLVNIGGVWKLYAGATASSTITITESDLRGGTLVVTPKLKWREKFNAVKPIYVDPTQDHQPTDAPPLENGTYVTEDGGTKKWKNLELPFTQSNATAQRLGKIELERSRNQVRIAFPGKPTLLRVEVWDIITFNIPRYYTSKAFRVIGVHIRDDFGVDLDLAEENDGMWNWSAEETAGSAPPDLVPPSTTVTAPTSVVVATEVRQTTDGVNTTYGKVTWTAALDSFVTGYELQWKKAADSNYQSVLISGQATVEAFVGPLLDAVSYDFRLRSTADHGVSAFVTPTGSPLTIGFDTTAPAVPTSLSVAAEFVGLFIQWTNPTDVDFHHTELYITTANVEPTPPTDRVATPGGGPGKEMEFHTGGLSFPTAFYIWFRSVDSSGNASAFTASITATTRALTAAEITDSILTTAMFASGIEPVGLEATLPDPVGWTGPKIIMAIDTQILYRHNTSTSPDTWDKLVKTASLEDGAVTTLKINALAVTSDELAANAAIFGKVAAGAIKSEQIVADEVKAINMATGAITAGNAAIANLAVINARIANLTIATGKVAANAITLSGATTDAGGSNPQASVTLTFTGGPAYILWAGQAGSGPTFAGYPTSAWSGNTTTGLLKRDSTIILSSQTLIRSVDIAGTMNASVALSFSESPAAGSKTMSMEVAGTNSGIGQNTMLVLELKK